MNLKKVLLSSVAAVTLTSVAAMAAANVSTTIGQDGTGDYLVFPMYAADDNGNWSTNIKVVNTNTTHAVIGKVVFREWKGSVEKVDFPIFLSPGDVWEGTVAKSGTNVQITTSDDSYFDGSSWASESAPKIIPFFAPAAEEDSEYGYVEVFGVAAIAGNAVTSGWTSGQLSKDSIKTKYIANDANLTYVDADSIFGEAILFADSTAKKAMTIPAVAFEGVTGLRHRVSTEVIGVNTLFQNTIRTGFGGEAADAGVVVRNIEDALAKSNVYMTYSAATATVPAETQLVLTQPMKNNRISAIGIATLASQAGYQGGTDLTDAGTTVEGYEYYLTYASTARDQEEHIYSTSNILSGGVATILKCYTEMCFIGVNGTHTASFAKGYVDFNFAQTAASPAQPGMPVIPLAMSAKVVGGQTITNGFYPAYKESLFNNGN